MDAPSPSMPPGAAPRGRRRSRRRGRTRRIGAIVVMLVVGVAAAGMGIWLTEPPQPDPTWPGAENLVVVPTPGTLGAPGDETRPNYLYSIVEGGVHAGIEMGQAIERDSVVAAHYAGLDPSQFRVERLPARTEAHVSYRIGQEVFWTRKKLVLEAGEKVLTDGTNIIRARCGNRVSTEELGPERPQEPDAEAFEQVNEPAAVAAAPPTDVSDLGALVTLQLQSRPFGGAIGHATSRPLFGPGSGSSGQGSGSTSGSSLGGSSSQGSGSTPDPGLGGESGQGPGSNPGPNRTPGPGLDPGPDLALVPGPGLNPWPGPGVGPWPGPGVDPDPNQGPGSPLAPTQTPEPTPEPSTMVLTVLGAAGWYFARVRRRSRARRTSTDHASC